MFIFVNIFELNFQVKCQIIFSASPKSFSVKFSFSIYGQNLRDCCFAAPYTLYNEYNYNVPQFLSQTTIPHSIFYRFLIELDYRCPVCVRGVRANNEIETKKEIVLC